MDDTTFHRTTRITEVTATLAVAGAGLYLMLKTAKKISRDSDVRFIERVLDSERLMSKIVDFEIVTPSTTAAKAALVAWGEIKEKMIDLATKGKLSSGHISVILDTGIMG